MKVEKLYEGQVFKSYRQVCETLGEPIHGGRSKVAQIKKWECYFSFFKDGNKIIIDKIFDEPIELINKPMGRKPSTPPLSQTNPKLASQWDIVKNGELDDSITRTNTDNVYWNCDKCSNNVYTSPIKRLNSSKGFTDDCITCPYCTLSNYAKIVYEKLTKCNVKFVQEYSFEDLIGTGNRKLRFDFAILNDDESLISLVEYDGGFHDFVESTQIHDSMKDDYCKNNNIPLLRIHHTDKDSIEIKINEFLGLITDSELNKVNELRKENEDLHKQIEALMNQIQHNTVVIQSILNK